jgi:hypothetical protein
MSYDEFYLNEYAKLLELAGSGHTTRHTTKALIDSAKVLIAEYVILTDVKDVDNDDIHFIMLEASTHSEISDIDFNAYTLAKLCMVDEDFKYFIERLISGVSHVSRLWKNYSEAKKQKISKALRLAEEGFIVIR